MAKFATFEEYEAHLNKQKKAKFATFEEYEAQQKQKTRGVTFEELEERQRPLAKPKPKATGASLLDLPGAVGLVANGIAIARGKKTPQQAIQDVDRATTLAIHNLGKGLSLGLIQRIPKLPGETQRQYEFRTDKSEESQPRGKGEKRLAQVLKIAGQVAPITKGLNVASAITRPILPAVERLAVKAIGGKVGTEVAKRVARGVVKAPGGAAVGYGVAKAEGKREKEARQDAAIWAGIEAVAPHVGPAVAYAAKQTPGVNRVLQSLSYGSRQNRRYANAEAQGHLAAADAVMRSENLLINTKRAIEEAAAQVVERAEQLATSRLPRKLRLRIEQQRIGEAVAEVFDAQRDAVDTAIANVAKNLRRRFPKISDKDINHMAAKEIVAQSQTIKDTAKAAILAKQEAGGLARDLVEPIYQQVTSHIDDTAQVMAQAGILPPTTEQLYRGASLRRTYQGDKASTWQQLLDKLEGSGDDGAGLLGSIPGKGAARKAMMQHLNTTPGQRAEWGLESFMKRLGARESLAVGWQGWAKEAQVLANQAVKPKELGFLDDAARRLYSDAPMANTAAWGPLRGLHIPKILEGQIKEVHGNRKHFWKVMETATGLWKANKTVYSPGTHVHNAVGDLLFTYLNDPVTLGSLPRATRETVKGMLARARRTPDPNSQYEIARRALALSGTFAETEFITHTANAFAAGDVKLLQRLIAWPRAIHKAASETYGSYDTITKLNAFQTAIDKGMPLEQAATLAQDVGLNYAALPKWVKQISRGVIPFAKFPIAAMTQTSKIMARNPSRAYSLFHAPEMYSRQKAKQDKVDLDFARLVMPKTWNPGLLVYIGKDSTGRLMFLSASTSVVWGQEAQLAAPLYDKKARSTGEAIGKAGKGLVSEAEAGNPFGTELYEAFTGARFGSTQPTVNERLPSATQYRERGKRAIRDVLPPVFDVSHSATTTSGPTMEHPQKRTAQQELLRLGGLTVYPLDPAAAYIKRLQEVQREWSDNYAILHGESNLFANMSPKEKRDAMSDASKQFALADKDLKSLMKYIDTFGTPKVFPPENIMSREKPAAN